MLWEIESNMYQISLTPWIFHFSNIYLRKNNKDPTNIQKAAIIKAAKIALLKEFKKFVLVSMMVSSSSLVSNGPIFIPPYSPLFFTPEKHDEWQQEELLPIFFSWFLSLQMSFCILPSYLLFSNKVSGSLTQAKYHSFLVRVETLRFHAAHFYFSILVPIWCTF